jgi:hypothetical protein
MCVCFPSRHKPHLKKKNTKKVQRQCLGQKFVPNKGVFVPNKGVFVPNKGVFVPRLPLRI